MNQKTKIILSFLTLIILLGGVWYFTVFRSAKTDSQQTSTNSTPTLTNSQTIPDPDIFVIQYDQSLGWSKSVSDIQNTEQLQQETINFTKNTYTISINISLIKDNNSQVYTGYQPETREYLTTTNPVTIIGKMENTSVARIATREGYTLVDTNSKLLRDNQTTYIYELPILVSKSGYITKTVIKYSTTNTNDNSLLPEADKLILSLT